MATINPVWKVWELPNNADIYGLGAAHRAVQPAWLLVTVSWTNITSATSDVCTPAPIGFLTDVSVQFSGTTVTSMAIEGSNDGVEYYVLNDPQGNALSAVNAEKIEQILERTVFVRPTATTSAAANVIICGRIPTN
jgi:hypothetical protein